MLFLNYIFIAEQNDQKIDVLSNNGKQIWLPWEIAWQFFTSQLNDDLNALLQIKKNWIIATYNRYPSALAKAQWAAVKI